MNNFTKFSFFLLLLISTNSFSDTKKGNSPKMANASYQCHRGLRAFIREFYPKHVFLSDHSDKWKKSKNQKEDGILRIEAKDYVRIDLSITSSEYKKVGVFCSYDELTSSVVGIGLNLPKTNLQKIGKKELISSSKKSKFIHPKDVDLNGDLTKESVYSFKVACNWAGHDLSVCSMSDQLIASEYKGQMEALSKLVKAVKTNPDKVDEAIKYATDDDKYDYGWILTVYENMDEWYKKSE